MMKQFLLCSAITLLSATCMAQLSPERSERFLRNSEQGINTSVVANIATSVVTNTEKNIREYIGISYWGIRKTPIGDLYELTPSGTDPNIPRDYVTGDGKFLLKAKLRPKLTSINAQNGELDLFPKIAEIMKAKKDDTSESVVTDIVKKSRRIAAQITTIKKTPIQNLYEVTTNREIFYATGDGEFLLFGSLHDCSTGINITARALNSLNTLKFSSLPLDSAIKKVKGNGEKEVAVFCSPMNYNCQELEKSTFSKMNNITIHVFMLPQRDKYGLFTEEAHIASDIWCSKDKVKTWEEWMLSGKIPPKADQSGCYAPLHKIDEFTKRKSIYDTPTLVIKSTDKLVSGLLSAQELEKLME